MGQAQINVRTRACSRTSIARTKQAALTHNVRGKELRSMSQCSEQYQVLSVINYMVSNNTQPSGLEDYAPQDSAVISCMEPTGQI